MNYAALITAINAATEQLQGQVANVANRALVLRNWLVGAYLVEFEQKGEDRAQYGTRLLERLAADLAAKGIKGLGVRSLRDCRTFYALYPGIRQPLVAEFNLPRVAAIRQPPVAESQSRPPVTKALRKSASADPLPPTLEPAQLAQISWAHFLELIRIGDPWKRAFYENELLRDRWSKRQLQRQIGSLLYERTGLSADKAAVVGRVRTQEPREAITELLRDPYILEFTGLAERAEYSEGELETALLDHLQWFLLELGRGFCFEARQFRMTEGRKHHRVDLVFYHRLLRCHVLIDLKIRAFEPADAGQMNFYVNWFKAHMMAEGDNPPVGILLCSDKDATVVEFATAGMDQKLFVSRYLVELPSADKLRAFIEADRDQLEGHASNAKPARKQSRPAKTAKPKR